MPRKSRSLLWFEDRLRVTENHMSIVSRSLSHVQEGNASGFANRDRQTARHAISRNAEIAVQLTYSYFIAYLKSLLGEMYRHRPYEVVAKAPGNMTYAEIVRHGSWTDLTNHMVDQVFRSLESTRNTRGLLKKILARTEVKPNTETLEAALMYLEVRNLVVHNAGKVDKSFAKQYGDALGVTAGQALKGQVSSKKAMRAIADLCREIDEGLIDKGYVSPAN